MKKISMFLIYFISFLYMEFLFRIICGFDKIFVLTNINMIIFILIFALLCFILSKILPEKGNKVIFYIILSLMGIWFSAQFIVSDVFDCYIDYALLTGAGTQVTEGAFLNETIIKIVKSLWAVALMFIPLIISILLRKKINFNKCKFKKIILCLVFLIILCFGYYGSLYINKNKTHSAYNLNYKVNNTTLNVEKLGVLNSLYLDIKRTIFGFEKSVSLIKQIVEPEEEEIVYDYNNLDIDFDSIISETNDDTIKMMSEYFKNESGTLQNEYTSYFEGKNLILFMAESFNEIAVNETLTPTLYKLVNNGFVFENFYSPTIYSTIGGEMQELTGLYPAAYGTFKAGTSYFPMGIATVFKNKNYSTYAYHDHYYTFQNRYLYLEKLGFDNFSACYNGLEKKIDCTLWPESDVEMIEQTFDDYATTDSPFMVFYATVSGHGSWTFNSYLGKKYQDEIDAANLEGYPETIKAYIAYQMELDRALELLLQKLEEKGILEDTVIALVGDHYPYMLTESSYTEEIDFFTNTLGKDLTVEINHSNFILYNSEMDKVVVDKVGSQIDVIPTLYNLFGIEYDSRLFTGKDILSTTPGLAMFADQSWVSDKGTYFARSGEFVQKDSSETIEDDYVDYMNEIVSNRINMSELILDEDYYKIAWNYLKTKNEDK